MDNIDYLLEMKLEIQDLIGNLGMKINEFNNDIGCKEVDFLEIFYQAGQAARRPLGLAVVVLVIA